MKNKMIVVMVVLVMATAGCVVSKYGEYGATPTSPSAVPTQTSTDTPQLPMATETPNPTRTMQPTPDWWPTDSPNPCPPFAEWIDTDEGEWCNWPDYSEYLTEDGPYDGPYDSMIFYVGRKSEITRVYGAIVIDVDGVVHNVGEVIERGVYYILHRRADPMNGEIGGWVHFAPLPE